MSDEDLFAEEMAGVKPLGREARVRLVKDRLSEDQQKGRQRAGPGSGLIAQFLAADEAKQKKLSGFFVGQIMKASKGQANPQMVNELLLKKLKDQS